VLPCGVHVETITPCHQAYYNRHLILRGTDSIIAGAAVETFSGPFRDGTASTSFCIRGFWLYIKASERGDVYTVAGS